MLSISENGGEYTFEMHMHCGHLFAINSRPLCNIQLVLTWTYAREQSSLFHSHVAVLIKH